jgi:hypothetical protein
VITRVPRSQLRTAELGPGYVAPLTITFANGDTWQLEIPPPSKRYARTVVHALLWLCRHDCGYAQLDVISLTAAGARS